MIDDYKQADAIRQCELDKVLEEWSITYKVNRLEDYTDKWYRTRRGRGGLTTRVEFEGEVFRVVQGPYHRLDVHAWVVGSGNDLYVVFVDAFKDRRGK
jgi:hypothetical protein